MSEIVQVANFHSIFTRHIGIFAAFVYSGANFFLAFFLQSAVESVEFGFFAFAIVLVQFGMGMSNALFSSPILVLLAEEELERAVIVRSFAFANFLFIGVGAIVLSVVLLAVGMQTSLVGIVCLQAAALWLRWFFRAVELASHNFVRPASADILYGIVTILVGALFFVLLGIEVFWALQAMLAGTFASMAVMGKGTIVKLFVGGWPSLAPFLGSFRKHGSWASIGVITTEITANLHAYVLTVWLGPAAFAPVATLALFFRPIPILMQAITQFERPVLARHIRAGATGALVAGVQTVSTIMSGAVLLNTTLIVAILVFATSMIGGGQYSAQILWPLLVLLAIAQFIRGLRTGPSAALQAAGHFRPLAMTTVYASAVTFGGTVIAVALGWEVVSMVLVSVMLGELIAATLIRRLFLSLLIGRKNE